MPRRIYRFAAGQYEFADRLAVHFLHIHDSRAVILYYTHTYIHATAAASSPAITGVRVCLLVFVRCSGVLTISSALLWKYNLRSNGVYIYLYSAHRLARGMFALTAKSSLHTARLLLANDVHMHGCVYLRERAK